MDDQQVRSAMIAGALEAARLGDEESTLRAVGLLVELSPDALRAAVWELAEDSGGLLCRLTRDLGDNAFVDLELLRGDGAAVAIDQLEPALRAAVRMLLSLANGRREDALEQVDLVAAAEDPAELAVVFVHLLMWTVQLQDVLATADAPQKIQTG